MGPLLAIGAPDRIERQLRCLAFGVCRPATPVSDDSPATPAHPFGARCARPKSLRDFVERGSILMRLTSKPKWAREGPIL